jgi:2-C-methyl-D-erythritol 4-phosphate cytidylyltransferase
VNTVAIIVAAGMGRRMGNKPKALLDLGGKPLLCHPLDVFQASPLIDGIVVAVPPGMLSMFRNEFASLWRYSKIVAWVEGGARRQDSVAAALDAVPADAKLIAVHDAARPCVTEALIRRVVEAAREKGAAIPGIKVVDTIKEINEAGLVMRSPARERLRAVQTPQVFSADLLRKAYRAVDEKGMTVTDDASLVDRMRHPVMVVEGERGNIKITVPGDIQRAKGILKSQIQPAMKAYAPPYGGAGCPAGWRDKSQKKMDGGVQAGEKVHSQRGAGRE